jgi:hypothetical protein
MRDDQQGQIVAGELFYDMTAMMVQLRHMPPPA